MTSFGDRIAKDLEKLGIPEADRGNFVPRFAGDTTTPLDTRERVLNIEIDELRDKLEKK